MITMKDVLQKIQNNSDFNSYCDEVRKHLREFNLHSKYSVINEIWFNAYRSNLSAYQLAEDIKEGHLYVQDEN